MSNAKNICQTYKTYKTYNLREPRYFAPWTQGSLLHDMPVPEPIQAISGQATAPFGEAILQFKDATLAVETCEELFTPHSPHVDLALNGVEIITNGSGSYH